MRRIVVFLAIPVICSGVGIGGGGHRQLNLILNEGILIQIGEKSEIFQSAPRREEPTATTSSCSSPSAEWLREQISKLPEEDAINFFDWHIHSLPFAYKIYVERRGMFDREYFGQKGEYTQEIVSIHAKSQDFWSHTGVDDDIEILCAHGSDIEDRSNLIQTLDVMFGSQYTDEYTIYDATDIQELIERLPGRYDYPLLTFNAFATKAKEEMGKNPQLSSEKDTLLFKRIDTNEEYTPSQHPRRGELAADTLAAYFLAHDSGGRMSDIEISNIHAISYSVGDCALSLDGHHGTPSQRRCATKFGASLSEQDEDLDLVDLQSRFNLWYENVDDLNDLCQYIVSGASTSLFDRSLVFGILVFVGIMFAF